MASRAFFQDVADALAGFLPPELRRFSARVTSANLKVWYDEWREHYEVQLVSKSALPARLRRAGRALEIGFHAEHPSADESRRAVDRLMTSESSWRGRLGTQAQAASFFGSDRWRRLSELWQEEGGLDDGAAIDAAERLAAYISCLEPVRRNKGGKREGP